MLAVVKGEVHDRVPFVQYSDNAGPNDEIWQVIGRDSMGLLQWISLAQVHYPNCRWDSQEFERDGLRGRRSWLHTPEGTLTQESLYQPTYGVAATREHYVKTRGDYFKLMAYLRDAVVTDNFEEIRRADTALGDNGLCHVSVPRTPYQQLWIEWVSLQDLGLHLVDFPDIVEEAAQLMAAIQRRIFALIPQAPVPYIVIPDNITAPAIGERYFRRYCLPLYQEAVSIAREKDIPVYGHLDGDLRPLWHAIGESGLQGIDSLSPPPDNDTSIAQARELWPDMRLCPNFPSSVHLADPEIIYETALGLCQQANGSGRLQIQISENVPPGVWRTSFPQIVRAINDFGRQ